MKVSKSHVNLKTRLQNLDEEDRKRHRVKQGLKENSDDKDLKNHQDLDKSVRDNVKTTTQLLEARFKINTKDISQKTAEG